MPCPERENLITNATPGRRLNTFASGSSTWGDRPEDRPEKPLSILTDPFPVLALILGVCLGSFYNVCIHRYLVGQTVNKPRRSYCPHCKATLTWWENIPLVSYVLLLGRCRHCKKPISARYPAVEALSGLTALALALRFGPTPAWLVLMVFAGMLIVAAFIDFAIYILPDGITLTGAALAWPAAVFVLGVPWLDSLLGAICGAGFFWLLQLFYRHVRRMEGMGTGDIKLMLMLGALTGWQLLPLSVMTAAVTSLCASLYYLARDRKGMQTVVPFGPFLSLGALVALLYGRDIMRWYLG